MVDWITLEKISGQGNDTVSIQVSPNNTGGSRQYYLDVRTSHGKSQTVNIFQYAELLEDMKVVYMTIGSQTKYLDLSNVLNGTTFEAQGMVGENTIQYYPISITCDNEPMTLQEFWTFLNANPAVVLCLTVYIKPESAQPVVPYQLSTVGIKNAENQQFNIIPTIFQLTDTNSNPYDMYTRFTMVSAGTSLYAGTVFINRFANSLNLE